MDYDLKYSKKEFYWGNKPHGLVVDSVKYIPLNSDVLDIGCGEGKDSLFLAKKSFNVTAVDISKVGIKKLKYFTKKEELKIKCVVSDIKCFLDTSDDFDVIFGMNVLQFMTQKNILSIIEKIKLKTKKNGFNVISSFIAETDKQKKFIFSKGYYFFDEGELGKLYKDWKIIFYEEKLGDWETHGEPEHRHFKVQLIAQKQCS